CASRQNITPAAARTSNNTNSPTTRAARRRDRPENRSRVADSSRVSLSGDAWVGFTLRSSGLPRDSKLKANGRRHPPQRWRVSYIERHKPARRFTIPIQKRITHHPAQL